MSNLKTLGLILAGGRVGELAALTLKRPKSAVPFGGMYRVIDCAMTNLTESGIETIGILSQYRPLSLMDHVALGKPWDLLGSRRGVHFLPPHTGTNDTEWYKGTADAIYQNMDFIREHSPEKILIVSGDHIYRMNYQALIEQHRTTGAGVTIAVTPVGRSQSHRYGIARLDDANRVIHYEEKPDKPESGLASMTVYLFEKDVLLDALQRNAPKSKTYQIYDEILPELVDQKIVYGYVFDDYWSYSRSLDEFFRANMDCCGKDPKINLSTWRLRTNLTGERIGDPPPMLIAEQAEIEGSMISPGCEIKGNVFNSILSPYVLVNRNATVENSILFEGVEVGEGARLKNVIIDKNVKIGSHSQIGCRPDEKGGSNHQFPKLLSSGLTVIGKNCRIPEGCDIGRNVIINPDCDIVLRQNHTIDHGETVGLDEGGF